MALLEQKEESLLTVCVEACMNDQVCEREEKLPEMVI
jgi:hypothetical protein